MPRKARPCALRRDLRAIGINVNEIASVASQTGHADVEALRADVTEPGPTLVRLSLRLRTILDTMQRRPDGRHARPGFDVPVSWALRNDDAPSHRWLRDPSARAAFVGERRSRSAGVWATKGRSTRRDPEKGARAT